MAGARRLRDRWIACAAQLSGPGEPGGELVVGEAHVAFAGVQVDDPGARVMDVHDERLVVRRAAGVLPSVGVAVAAPAGPATTPPSTPAASPAAPIPAAPRSIPRRVVPGSSDSRLASADS